MAGVNSFFNPLPDVPLYYMIKYFNDFPFLISFLQGLWFGLLMYVIYRTIFCYFDISKNEGKVKAFVCFLIVISGNATFFQIGVSSNEIMLAVFYLLSFYLLSEEIFIKQSGRKSSFIVAGFVLGAAMGLKLTGVIYCITSGITLIVFHISPMALKIYDNIIFSVSRFFDKLTLGKFWGKNIFIVVEKK